MKPIRIRQSARLPSERTLDRYATVVLALPPDLNAVRKQELPYGAEMLRRIKQRASDFANGSIVVFDLSNNRATRVVALAVADESDTYMLLTAARKAVAESAQNTVAALPVMVCLEDERLNERVAEALVAASLAGCVDLPHFKSKAKAPQKLQTIALFNIKTRIAGNRLLAEAAGNELARRLTLMPGNTLTPALYRKEVTRLARQHGWQMTFYDIGQLKRRKAGAFLAVVQGSEERDAGIVKLRYRPAKPKGKPIALVGKGLCFDTGGVNLKPARGMFNMHEDMEGSAVALGTLLALTQLRVGFPIDCWLALAQNHIGPRAYKPNDVVTASNGTTIEVVHTDAEGRMVLADTLAIASKEKPRLIIDYATLTGACIHALGTRYSGIVTNRDDYHAPLIEAGRHSGERVWTFPNDKDFDDALESTIADIKQCTLEGEADHILAARFLQRFIDAAIPWVHIDLGAGRNRGGLGHIPTDVTGFGVRYTLELLLGRHLEKTA